MLNAYLLSTFLLVSSCAVPQTHVRTTATRSKSHEHLSQSDIYAIKRLVRSASREPIRGELWEDYSPEDTIEVRTACPTCIWGDVVMVKRISGDWRIISKSTWTE